MNRNLVNDEFYFRLNDTHTFKLPADDQSNADLVDFNIPTISFLAKNYKVIGDEDYKNQCSDSNCEEICIPTNDSNFRCSCQIGSELKADGKSCGKIDSDNLYVFINHQSAEVINVNQDQSVSRWPKER